MRVSIALKKDMIAIYSHELGINITEHIKDKDLFGSKMYVDIHRDFAAACSAVFLFFLP